MRFIVYGKDNCQYCTKAVNLLTQKNKPFTYMKLGESFTREELISMFPSAKTYPQIEHIIESGVVHVGGYEELVEYLD